MSNEELFEELGYRLNDIRKESWLEGYKEANKEKELDLLGRENVNFSITDIEKEEKRKEYKKQRLDRGFDDTELWNLDTTILKFTLPRLKRFRECTIGYPSDFKNHEEWLACLDKMINAIEKILENDESDETYKDFELFKKYFFSLWW